MLLLIYLSYAILQKLEIQALVYWDFSPKMVMIFLILKM